MAFLVLSNGMRFEGELFGAADTAVGQLVFTTGVVGYLETLTDPRYAGQIVVQTFPTVGNYGVIEEDLEGPCAVRGYVVREWCPTPSNFRCQYDLDTYLKQQGVCGICGVDTRSLTRILREEGPLNAMLCDRLPTEEEMQALRSYTVTDAVAAVSRREPAVYEPAEGQKYNVTLVDYGVRRSLIDALCARGCRVTVVPHDTDAETILAGQPDGVVLSGGPGDPRENTACIENLKALLGQVPVWGMGLGHQLAALAMGGEVQPLPCGHRGASQPVKELGGTRTFITGQNHGYAVTKLPATARLTYENLNDGSCEGLEYPAHRCFTIQFDPDTAADVSGTAFLFDRFTALMGGNTDAER